MDAYTSVIRSLKHQRKCNCWSLVGTLTFGVFGLLLSCTSVTTQFSPHSTSQTVTHGIIRQDIPCYQVCEYDDWFQRARCDERNLSRVPSSDGCEDTIILELQGNHLTNISVNSLLGYNHLKTLDLSNNGITVICPGALLSTKYLTNFLLNDNNLNELLNGIFTGPENRLTRIYLQRSNIVNIHEHVFQGLKALTSIYLSYNQIQSLPPSVFHGLTRLQYIMLGYNELDHLDAFTFKDLVELEVLSLKHNKIKHLPHGLFHGLSSLREVILSNNALVTLPSPQNLGINSIHRLYINNNVLSQSESILPYLLVTSDRLEIRNNPLTCDCAFISIQEWYNYRSAENSIEYSVTCYLGDMKYYLDDTLPISCDHLTSNIMPYNEPIQEHTTNTIQHYSTDEHLSYRPDTSEVLQPTNGILPGSEYVCQRFQCNQYCAEDKTDKKILILSICLAACVTVFLFSWVCYITYYCYSSRACCYLKQHRCMVDMHCDNYKHKDDKTGKFIADI